MSRITLVCVVVFLAMSAAIAQAQETGTASPVSVPVATRTQADCTGFIAKPSVQRDLFVFGGADDDFHSVVRQFSQGDSIFISSKSGDLAVGTQYSVIRPANELFRTMRYQGERSEISKLGKPYEDIAQIRVTHVNPDAAVAQVTFSCESVIPGDIVVPFQPRAIPQYTVSAPLDHFAPVDEKKQQGRIVAGRNNFGYLSAQTVVYLNLGESQGAKPGQRYRIYKVLSPEPTGFLTWQKTPPEVVGEAVVLSVQSTSCVAMVVSSYREISAGDYVESNRPGKNTLRRLLTPRGGKNASGAVLQIPAR